MFQIDVIVDECVEMWSDMWSDIKNNEVLTDKALFKCRETIENVSETLVMVLTF